MSILDFLVVFLIFTGGNTYLSSILKFKDVLVCGAEIKSNDYKDLHLTRYEKEALDLVSLFCLYPILTQVKIFLLFFFKFKERVVNKLPEPFMRTDFYLIRWLRRKDFDIPQAEHMLMQVI